MLTKTLLPALLVLAPSWFPVEDTYNLRMTAPVGTQFAYKMEMNLDISGQTAVLRGKNVMKVASVDANGDYTIEGQLEDAVLDMGGGEQPVPHSLNTTKNNAKGEIVEAKASGEELPEEGYRFANIMAWSFEQAAYKVGDTITITRAAGKTTGGRPSETVLKLVQIEEINGKQAVKVEFTAKETSGDLPIEMSGTGWVDPKVGMMVKFEATFKNMPMPGAPVTLDGKMSYIQI